MFCKSCGGLLNGTSCTDCGMVQERKPLEIPDNGVRPLTEQELAEQEHIQKQRDKQKVWAVPDERGNSGGNTEDWYL